jgi:hypothetical protein
MKLTIKQVENKIKAVHRASERRKAKSRRVDGPCRWNEASDDWTRALSLDWQVRNKQFKGCNGKAIFDPVAMCATSYSWWTFVRRIKGKIVFNAHGYSVTTSGHQHAVRSILEALGIKIDLEVDMRASLTDFESKALPVMYRHLFELEIASNRRNAKDRSAEIKAVKRDIATARRLGATCARETIQGIKESCAHDEAQRLADLAAKRERAQEVNRATTGMIRSNVVADLSSLSA